MAEKKTKRQYPIRLDISEPGRARAAPARNANLDPLEAVLPQAVAAQRSASADTDRYWSEGRIPEALGAAIRPMATVPAGAVNDLVVSPLAALGSGAARAVGGFLGFTGDETKRKTKAAPAAATRDRTIKTIAPRQAEPEITPQDRALAYVDTLLRGPVTMREAQAATNMLPAPAKPQTNKDKIYGSTADLSQALFSNQVEQAKALAATDPEGAQAIVEKATDEYFKRQSAILGVNPANLAMAQMLDIDEE
jgi:hypothetical protein